MQVEAAKRSVSDFLVGVTTAALRAAGRLSIESFAEDADRADCTVRASKRRLYALDDMASNSVAEMRCSIWTSAYS